MDENTPLPAAGPLTPLPGSDRQAVPGATTSGGVPAGTPVALTVVLRRRAPLDAASAGLGRVEFAARHGASPADVTAVTTWAQLAGLQVVGTDPASRRVRLEADVETVARAFGTDLTEARTAGDVAFRQRTGDLAVPAALLPAVVAVLGIDDRPQARSRAVVLPRAAAQASFTPVELAALYAMPEARGEGRRIAVVELGGGYTDAELDTYFAGLGVGRPEVTAVGVDGADNAPEDDPNGADGEVLLDIEVAGGIAPGASIVVYFAPNTDAGFLDAVSEAVHADPTPTALSISWGQSEDSWTGQARTAMDEAFADGAALGVTVTCAAGDDGSADRVQDGRAHVDFPASSPHALACGGTRLVADAAGTVTSETVWGGVSANGATGGGVSRAFGLPDWQQGAGVPAQADGEGPGRGVPDVSAVADPQTGYAVLVDGRQTVIGGTSAVAPLWAGLVCRLAELLDRPLGLAQPALYRGGGQGAVPAGFRDVTEGSNGAYRAGPGWDACTGLGVPDGAALLAALQAAGQG